LRLKAPERLALLQQIGAVDEGFAQLLLATPAADACGRRSRALGTFIRQLAGRV